MGQEHDEVAVQLNTVFDESDDYLSAEIESLLNDRFAASILEFQTEYSNRDKKFHLIELIKDEDPHDVANYVLSRDLGPITNDKYRSWARLFLRFLQRKIAGYAALTLEVLNLLLFTQYLQRKIDPNAMYKVV